MTEKRNDSAATVEKPVSASKKELPKLSVPMIATIDDILRASKIVMDKGGTVRFGEISKMFGARKSDQNLLGFALNGAVAFGILEPHSGRAPYVLSGFGKGFLTSSDEQQRKTLLPKFLGFEGYKDIIIGMRNNQEKSMKKQMITDMWINITGGKIGTRQTYTRTFASVGEWCGALNDTGQSCVLKDDAEQLFSKMLAGEETKAPSTNVDVKVTAQPAQNALQKVSQLSIDIVQCPICNKTDIVVNEKYLDKIPIKGGTLLLFERTYQCQGCSNKFVRTIKEVVPAPD